MINSDNIGRRIRILRKQRHISQERMAEDLGMYQADISNLECAMGGSGITDLFKLDMIADYFGISLVELLNGFEDAAAPAGTASENKQSEGYEMKDHTIVDIKYGFKDYVFASELKLRAPDKRIQFVSFSEMEDEPRFYKTMDSIFSQLLSDRGEAKHEEELNRNCFLSGEDYIDIFQNIETAWVDICRYLIFTATEDEKTVKQLIKDTKGKTFREIEVPVPEREPEDSRRSMYHLDEGIACGPDSISSIDAEIAVEKDGKTIYLHAQWVDAAGDEIYYQATGESVYECYKKIYENDDENLEEELIEAKEKVEETVLEDDPDFAPFYEELKKMVFQELRDNDLEDYIDDLEGCDEDED